MGVIFVDSSVWVDWLNDRETIETDILSHIARGGEQIAIGDLVLAEVLQGIRSDRYFETVRTLLARFVQVRVADHHAAVAAARHYHTLRVLSVTVRKTIDTLIATRCILDELPLLYSDRDFDPFVVHCGLRSAGGAPLGDI